MNVCVGNGHPLNVCVGSGHICHALDGGHMNVRVGCGHNCHARDGGHMNVRVAGTGQICVTGCAQIVIDGAPPTGPIHPGIDGGASVPPPDICPACWSTVHPGLITMVGSNTVVGQNPNCRTAKIRPKQPDTEQGSASGIPVVSGIGVSARWAGRSVGRSLPGKDFPEH